jgi:hypothetical protein
VCVCACGEEVNKRLKIVVFQKKTLVKHTNATLFTMKKLKKYKHLLL